MPNVKARMLREFGELLDRYTQDQRLLLVTEDLHWSDQATVTLINHVARRRGKAHWMWLATFRAAEVIAEDHPMKTVRHELRLHRLCDEIALDPFSEQELADYVDRRLGDAAASDAFVKALHRHTDGLPLFVANVIDELQLQAAQGSGVVAHDLPDALETLSVPESLAGVMERRIARLPADQIAMLETASACGLEFAPIVVALALSRDVEWVVHQCAVLAQRQQWLVPTIAGHGVPGESTERYAFRHALVRHVFRNRLGALARAQLHRRVAVALADAAPSRQPNWRRTSSWGRTPTPRCRTTPPRPPRRCSSSHLPMPCAWRSAVLAWPHAVSRVCPCRSPWRRFTHCAARLRRRFTVSARTRPCSHSSRRKPRWKGCRSTRCAAWGCTGSGSGCS
jgi:predicted ATPase